MQALNNPVVLDNHGVLEMALSCLRNFGVYDDGVKELMSLRAHEVLACPLNTNQFFSTIIPGMHRHNIIGSVAIPIHYVHLQRHEQHTMTQHDHQCD